LRSQLTRLMKESYDVRYAFERPAIDATPGLVSRTRFNRMVKNVHQLFNQVALLSGGETPSTPFPCCDYCAVPPRVTPTLGSCLAPGCSANATIPSGAPIR
jgi:hypothetical protein